MATPALFLAIAAAAACLALLLSRAGVLRTLELKTYDWRFVLHGPRPARNDIVIVLIDPASDARFPEPRVFWQPHFAALLKAAQEAGARAVGLDVFFSIPVARWLPDADRELAAAFAAVSVTTPVVLGYDTLQPVRAGVPLYIIASAFDALGFANLTVDADGYARRQRLRGDNAGSNVAFAARLYAAATASGTATLPPEVLIRYHGPAGTFRTVSFAAVVAAAERNQAARLHDWLGGKVVLVGTDDPADMHPTPFYRAGGSHWDTPGIEIQANTLATLMDGASLRYLRHGWLLSVLAALLGAVLVFFLRGVLAELLLAAVLVVYFTFAVHAQAAGLVLPVVAPVLALAFGAFGSYGLYSATEGRRRRLLQRVFTSYVSEEVGKEILACGDIPLGGVRREVTVLFSDLRNYTSHCQGADPHAIVAELNEYFAEMTASIRSHGGMVNKFIGDGIMAIFGAPAAHPDHALRAVRCALEMVRKNDAFNARRTAARLDPLVIGIGLHTGDAVVGNIGAPEKMEYTAIGDTVNVASRIESENKTFGTKLLISAATYEAVRDHTDASVAGEALLKGVATPVLLYRVMGSRMK